jgi:hypothetical protein
LGIRTWPEYRNLPVRGLPLFDGDGGGRPIDVAWPGNGVVSAEVTEIEAAVAVG